MLLGVAKFPHINIQGNYFERSYVYMIQVVFYYKSLNVYHLMMIMEIMKSFIFTILMIVE